MNGTNVAGDTPKESPSASKHQKDVPECSHEQAKGTAIYRSNGLTANLQQLKSALSDPPPMPPSISWAATSIGSKLQPEATPSPIPIDDSLQRMRTPAATISSAICVSLFTPVKQNALPLNEPTTNEDANYIKIGEVNPGAPNHPWFLVLGIMAKYGYKVDETFLGRLKGVFQVLASCVANFNWGVGVRKGRAMNAVPK
jgi:hypothetical protein